MRMSLRATKSSWKIRKPVCKREPLGYEHVFNETDTERLQHGLNGNTERRAGQQCDERDARPACGFEMADLPFGPGDR